MYGKRNTESVSKLYETDCVIRFIKKFANFFMKRITQSVSLYSETDCVIRFTCSLWDALSC